MSVSHHGPGAAWSPSQCGICAVARGLCAIRFLRKSSSKFAVALIATQFCLPQSVHGQSPIENQLQNISVNPAQRAIGEVIEDICPPPRQIVSDDLQDRCDEVAGAVLGPTPDVDAAREGLQAMAPEEDSAVSATQIDTSVTQFSNVGARLAALRRGLVVSGAQQVRLNVDGINLSGDTWGGLEEFAANKGGAAGDATNFGPWGVFISGNFVTGDKDATDRESGFDFDVYGVTAGVDYRFTDALVLGLAFGYENTDADLDAGGGEVDTDTYSLSVYGTYYPTEALYIDGIVGAGRTDIDQKRAIRYSIPNEEGGITSVDQTASSDPDGTQVFFTLSTGYDFTRDGWTFGPNFRLEFRHVDVDDFRERLSDPTAPGNGLGMQVDDQDFASFTSTLGAQASYALSTPWGVVVPQARGEWVHEFENDPEIITAQFLGGPTAPTTGDNTFRLRTDEPDEDYFNVGAGFSAVFARGVSGYFYYQTVLGFSGLDSNGFGGGLRLEF